MLKHFSYIGGVAVIENSSFNRVESNTFRNRTSNYKIYRTDMILVLENNEEVMCYIDAKKQFEIGDNVPVFYPKKIENGVKVILAKDHYLEICMLIYIFLILFILGTAMFEIPISKNVSETKMTQMKNLKDWIFIVLFVLMMISLFLGILVLFTVK